MASGTGGGIGGATGGGSGGGLGSAGACGQTDLFEACVFAPDGGYASHAFAATLTVTELTTVDGGACDRIDNSTNRGATTRVALDGGWVVYFRPPVGAPLSIDAGEPLELSIDAVHRTSFTETISQTFSLGRNGQPFAVAATRTRYIALDVPDLGPYGLQLQTAGAACGFTAFLCNFNRQWLRFTAADGGTAALAAPSQATLGPWTLAVEAADDVMNAGSCDSPTTLRLAGVRSP